MKRSKLSLRDWSLILSALEESAECRRADAKDASTRDAQRLHSEATRLDALAEAFRAGLNARKGRAQ